MTLTPTTPPADARMLREVAETLVWSARRTEDLRLDSLQQYAARDRLYAARLRALADQMERGG
jgi:hypothetical protein